MNSSLVIGNSVSVSISHNARQWTVKDLTGRGKGKYHPVVSAREREKKSLPTVLIEASNESNRIDDISSVNIVFRD